MSSLVGKLPSIRFAELSPSGWVLIAANVLPLLGVILLGWSAFDIVFLYWLENVMLGAINLLKMFTCAPDEEVFAEKKKEKEKLLRNASGLGMELDDVQNASHEYLGHLEKSNLSLSAAHQAAKLFFMPFFMIHYGGFCFVHGIFVFVLLSGDGPLGAGGAALGLNPFNMVQSIPQMLSEKHLWWAVLALAGSHLYSFFRNYLGRGEFRRTILPELMIKPYGRIVLLHVALLFGAFVIVWLGSPIFLLLILIVGKTILDLKLHLREHQQLEEIVDVSSGGVA